MEAAFILARFLQYAAASVLFGSTLLLLWAGLELRATKPLLAAAGVGLALAGAVGLGAQTALLTGSLADALRLETLTLVMQSMAFGPAAVVRIIMGLAATLIILGLPSSRQTLTAILACGAVASISFAWSGHAAATEGSLGTLHLASDAAHALAATGWVGALIVFLLMAARVFGSTVKVASLAHVLRRFSPLGILLVAVLVVTGLVNSWLIIGFRAWQIASTTYGMLLIAKLAAFALMLALAAYHRQRLVPALVRNGTTDGGLEHPSPRRARWSLTSETLAGLAILALVAILGTLSPLD